MAVDNVSLIDAIANDKENAHRQNIRFYRRAEQAF